MDMEMSKDKQNTWYMDGLVQDCSNVSVLAMEFLQPCTKSSIIKYLQKCGHIHTIYHEGIEPLTWLPGTFCRVCA